MINVRANQQIKQNRKKIIKINFEIGMGYDEKLFENWV